MLAVLAILSVSVAGAVFSSDDADASVSVDKTAVVGVPYYYVQSVPWDIGTRNSTGSVPPGLSWRALAFNESGDHRSIFIEGTPTTVGTYTFTVSVAKVGELNTKESYVFTITVKDQYTVAFNAAGGSCGSSSISVTAGDSMTLPSAENGIKVFDGWYTSQSGDTKAGNAGQTYIPNGSTTLYAQWADPAISFDRAPSATIPAGGTFSYTPKTTPADATISIINDPTGSLRMAGNTVTGVINVTQALTYYVHISASAPGYATTTQVIEIIVPVIIYEELEDVVEIGNTWTHTLSTDPASATVSLIKVAMADGSVAKSDDYVIEVSGKSVSFKPKSPGTYVISLLASAPGKTSSTNTVTIEAVSPTEDTGTPDLGRLILSAAGAPQSFYFVAYNVIHAQQISWDFGDGSTHVSGANVIHQYTKAGKFSVTATLTNTFTAVSVEFKAEVLVLSVGSENDAWIGSYYSYSFEFESALEDPEIKVETDWAWLDENVFRFDGKWIICLSGTPSDVNLAGQTHKITILSAGTVIDEYDLAVNAKTDASTLTATFTHIVNGKTVTLTNTGSSSNGVVMFIDWGDGAGDIRQPSNKTATHTYGTNGVFYIKMTLKNADSVLTGSGYATIGGTSQQYILIYYANGGIGSMSGQYGSKVVVSGNAFVFADNTFNGWNTKFDGTGRSYSPGDVVEMTDNAELYAQWIDASGNPVIPDEEESDGINWADVLAVIAIAIVCVVLCTFVRVPLFWLAACAISLVLSVVILI